MWLVVLAWCVGGRDVMGGDVVCDMWLHGCEVR